MIKILVLAANPSSTSALQLDEEIREIRTRIRTSEHRDLLQIDARLAARPNDIIQAIFEDEPDIIHFSGHGSDTGKLLFQDDSGNVMSVSPAALTSLMKAVRVKVRLVFLNACYSNHQADIIGEEIDFVVGMSDSVSDGAAIQFAGAFYSALGFGRTITESFEIARSALLLNGIMEEDTPKLQARTGASPSFATLEKRPAIDWRRDSEKPLVIVDKAESAPASLQYRSVRDGDRLRIEPNDQYLDTVHSSGELTELSFWYSPWRLKFALPAIDIKLINNTRNTVFFHRAVFVVKTSTSDPRPIPVFWAQSYEGNLAFSNAGWGEMQNAKLTFGLADSRDAEVDKLYEMPLDGTASAGYRRYNIADFVDDSELDHVYPEDVAHVIGDLQYEYRDVDGRLTPSLHPVRVAVRLGAMRFGLPRPPSYYYNLELPISGKDYRVELPISHSLATGEVDRFQIEIGSVSSAHHEFKVELHYNNEEFVETSWINLNVFLSQSEAQFIRPAPVHGDEAGR